MNISHLRHSQVPIWSDSRLDIDQGNRDIPDVYRRRVWIVGKNLQLERVEAIESDRCLREGIEIGKKLLEYWVYFHRSGRI